MRGTRGRKFCGRSRREAGLIQNWSRPYSILERAVSTRRLCSDALTYAAVEDSPHIYLDHNASTLIAPEVLEGIRPYLEGHYSNPSSAHGAARPARQADRHNEEGGTVDWRFRIEEARIKLTDLYRKIDS